MLRRTSARQLNEWAAYEQVEPFGEKRDDYRAASIVQMLANINRDPRKTPKAYQIEDFLLRFGPRESTPKTSRQSAEAQNLVMRQIYAIYSLPMKET